jgi:ComF family protein
MLCRTCRLAPPPFVRAVSHGVYEGRMREAIHALKYDRLHSAARELGRLLAGAIAQLAGEAPVEMLVIPVPLHRSKYAQRGFNQSRSLAVEALKFLHASHPQWQLALAPSTLMRLRATGSQAGLAPRERRINVRGAFSVSDPSKVTAQNILLVDDILTTGATARAAAQTLLKAGAASVWVATLARAQRSTGFGRPINSARDQERDDDSEEDGEILTGPAMQVDPNAASADSSTLRKQPSS